MPNYCPEGLYPSAYLPAMNENFFCSASSPAIGIVILKSFSLSNTNAVLATFVVAISFSLVANHFECCFIFGMLGMCVVHPTLCHLLSPAISEIAIKGRRLAKSHPALYFQYLVQSGHSLNGWAQWPAVLGLKVKMGNCVLQNVTSTTFCPLKTSLVQCW